MAQAQQAQQPAPPGTTTTTCPPTPPTHIPPRTPPPPPAPRTTTTDHHHEPPPRGTTATRYHGGPPPQHHKTTATDVGGWDVGGWGEGRWGAGRWVRLRKNFMHNDPIDRRFVYIALFLRYRRLPFCIRVRGFYQVCEGLLMFHRSLLPSPTAVYHQPQRWPRPPFRRLSCGSRPAALPPVRA